MERQIVSLLSVVLSKPRDLAQGPLYPGMRIMISLVPGRVKPPRRPFEGGDRRVAVTAGGEHRLRVMRGVEALA